MPLFQKSKTSVGSIALMAFFTLFWCGITGLFDFILIRGAIRQCQALSYPTAVGTVISSHMTSSGKHAHAEIVTQFEANGKTYVTDQWRYDAWNGRGAGAPIPRHPPGSHPTVHYPPDNPANAILEPGLHGQDGFLWLFLTPFNLVGCLLLWGIGYQGWSRLRPTRKEAPEEEGWTRNDSDMTIRLDYPLSIGLAFLILFAGPILSVVILGVTGLGELSFWLPFGIWLALIATAAGFCWRGWRIVKTGHYDLRLDRPCGTLWFPPAQGGDRVFLRNISSVEPFCVEKPTIRGGKSNTWHLRLRLHTGGTRKLDAGSEDIAQTAARGISLAAGLPNPAP